MIRVCTTKLLIKKTSREGSLFVILSVTMKKKTKKPELVQPRIFTFVIAGVVVAALLLMSVYYIKEVSYVISVAQLPQRPVIISLELAQILAAIAPLLIGVLVFLSAKGDSRRRFVVAAAYMGIYWLIQSLFAAFVPTLPFFNWIFGDAYRDSGVNFFLSYVVGLFVTLLAYLFTKKRTMNVNHWGVISLLIVSGALSLLTVWNYFFV